MGAGEMPSYCHECYETLSHPNTELCPGCHASKPEHGPWSVDERLGQDIGPYRFERVLGEGSFARVYRVHHNEYNHSRALKVLADNPSLGRSARAS